ncbi:hyaluronidase-1 [Megalops cyprinoides]|uniref:hyaluronidase-1 n=1 Tax=Megalops cyprinoides TaxID=118141 RepID=UPI0018647737|nr:hyaluronidase-1 [Megalops cyprinoides]
MSPLLFLCLWFGSALGVQQMPHYSLPHLPFLTVWNAPTEPCMSKHGVDLDLSVFDIVLNQNQTFMGRNITIFYESKLGRYPRYAAGGEAVNGGVPQNSSLQEHLRDARADIAVYIPRPKFRGLAVIDWESWRPLWARNWESKRVYWEGSRALVREKHPGWTPEQVEVEAEKEFQEAGRAFMEETLRLGRGMRPGGFWGFYGFPCCYNYQYKNTTANYTGACPEVEVKRNNELAWLWNASSALYPDIYLEIGLRGRGDAILRYTHYRVLEAMRVAALVTPIAPPVLPYARIAYTYSLQFLSQEDLIHTIGESAALGAAGVVLWGDAYFSRSQAACQAVKDYLDGTLGRYVVNVTTAASLCSRLVCSSQGRCRRKDPASTALLQLDPVDWSVLSHPGQRGARRYSVHGRPSKASARDMAARFQCQCYPGWAGRHCHKRLEPRPHRQTEGAPKSGIKKLTA